MFSKMMFIDNKEEVGAQGQRLNEPNSGVPIKKRPFQLTNPSSLEPCVHPFDKFPLTPKHFTPKSPLDLIIPLGFEPGNPSSSDLDKPAGVVTNPLHDLNEIGMGRNYYPLKQTANPNLGMEMLQVGNAPKSHLSISGNMLNKNFNQCSTDLSLTGPSTISSKTCFKPSHNLSKNTVKISGFDLNLPTADTWDSAMNDSAHTEPVEALAKQTSVSGMIPHGVGSGVIPNGVVSGLVLKGAGNNLKLPNMGKLSEKCNQSEVTLDLQLKLPPRPELRMKNLEIYSSDLSLSLSGKDLNCSPEPVNVKPRPLENSPKIKDKDITNPNAKPVAQNQVIVKQESRDVTLPEKVVQASGLKDQSLTLPEKVVQASGLKDQSLASGSVVKKEPVDTTSHAQNPLGIQLDKSPCSGSESRQAKQAEMSETNSLTKGIDLNSATPLPEVSICGKLVNPVLAESVVVGQITQSAISQSDAHHNPKKIDNSLAPTPPLVGTEDIKPVITSSASPALVVHDGKRMVPMASDGLSQGSADMDCSEEGQNLPKSATAGKTIKITNCETNASSSSSVAINPKQEPGTIGEFDNVQIGGTPRGENGKSLVPLNTPTSKENQIQIPMQVETSITQDNENDTPSSSTKLTDLPNKDMQGLCLDMEAGGSKSRSPSTSISREREEVDPSSERENVTSSRQTEGNNVLRRRFRRTDLGPDGPQFERRKSRMLPWDEGSNIHSNRGQRWEGQRFSQFVGDRFENGDSLNRRPFNMANRKRLTNSFNGRFVHNKYRGSRFTRTNSNTDMNFDEGNDGRKSRPHPRFQDRRRFADVSPRGADELDAPVFEHPSNHYKRVDHNTRRERNCSPGPRRGPHQWTPPGEMIGGHPDLLTRVDTRIRSPGRRPYFKKDSLNRRHASPPYNRVRKPGRGGMHWNNGRQRYNAVGPHGPDADVQNLEAYDQLRCQGGEMMPFHARYPENDGAYSDGGGSHGRVRNYETAMSRPREAGEQDEYRYNNRGPHGWREGNPTNNGDKLKRRRY